VAVLAVIAGSFLFLGLHAVLPNWKKAGVVTAFLGTLLLVGIAGALK
jgi:zinc transporter ZupT